MAVWASHGRYYDFRTDQWRWQRPGLFGTCEDILTQTIVVPFLMPMLENAGAVVFSPRGAHVISPWGPRDFPWGHVISPGGPRDFPVGPS